MNKRIVRQLLGTALCMSLMLTACRPAYHVSRIEAEPLTVDASLDARPHEKALALMAPYKEAIDSVMNTPLGELEESIDRFKPESPLSNLVADVLLEAAERETGLKADVAVMNVGGIRNSLSAGTITVGNVYEILPFENALCVLTLKGKALTALFENVAARGGNGISGARLLISPDGKLLEATVAGRPVDDGRTYTVSTLDYLAEGNDGMTALLQAETRTCPEGATIRSLFSRYVEQQTALGRKVSAKTDGRITIKQ